MTLFWTRTWDALAGALFPTPCVACGGLIDAHDPPLCAECWRRLPLIDGNLCRCGFPLRANTGGDCGRCRRKLSAISLGVALGSYEGGLRECVVALKYQGRHRTASRLAGRLQQNERCRAILETADLLIGVPLHPERLRVRGFNQADLLARALAKRDSLPVLESLQRTRDTPSQTHLSARKRRLNVRGAFAVKDASSLDRATVVLVDDVATTGATLRECASTLLSAGVREVRSITVARAE